jgi:hypothetical protein
MDWLLVMYIVFCILAGLQLSLLITLATLATNKDGK